MKHAAKRIQVCEIVTHIRLRLRMHESSRSDALSFVILSRSSSVTRPRPQSTQMSQAKDMIDEKMKTLNQKYSNICHDSFPWNSGTVMQENEGRHAEASQVNMKQ